MIKLGLKRLASWLGYDITKSKIDPVQPPSKEWGNDPFLDMARLVSTAANSVIFDVGAHYGHVSREFHRVFPNSSVYAFEPYPDSFAELEKNTASDGGVKAFPFGFAEVRGRRNFCSNQASGANSLLETDSRGHKTWGACVLETNEHIEVDFETLDGFVSSYGLKNIDILKLDCQGAEPLIIAGAEKSLRDGIVKLIYMEIITLPTYIGQVTFHEALKMLENCGFSLFNLYNLSVTESGFLRQVDAIFVRSEGLG